MKKTKGLLATITGLLLLSGVGASRSVFAGTIASGRVVCSTVAASPTTVSAGSPFTFKDVTLINSNTNYILIGDSSTSFSTSSSTGTARLASTANTEGRLELRDYQGAITCVGSAGADAAGNTLDFWRTK